MGLFNGLLGNSSKIDVEEALKKFDFLFGSGEIIEAAYKLVRDMIVFTNRRIIFIDIQGMTGKKTEYLSIPYKSIVQFSVESNGHFDLDAELKIWISGRGDNPIVKKFTSSNNIYEVQSILAAAVAKC